MNSRQILVPKANFFTRFSSQYIGSKPAKLIFFKKINDIHKIPDHSSVMSIFIPFNVSMMTINHIIMNILFCYEFCFFLTHFLSISVFHQLLIPSCHKSLALYTSLSEKILSRRQNFSLIRNYFI